MNKVQINFSTRQLMAYLRATPAKTNNAINKAFLRLTMEGQRFARNQAPKAETTLVNSILRRRESLLHHQVVANQNYARAVEEGSGPGGTIPAQSLDDWIRVKGITPINIHTSDEQMRFLITRSIRQRGSRAQPYMAPAFQFVKKRMPGLVLAELNKAILPRRR